MVLKLVIKIDETKMKTGDGLILLFLTDSLVANISQD